MGVTGLEPAHLAVLDPKSSDRFLGLDFSRTAFTIELKPLALGGNTEGKGGKLLLSEYVESYALSHEIRRGTLEQYRVAMNVLNKWRGCPVEVAELSDDLINRFLASLSKEAKPHTVASKKRHLLALWRSAADEGLVAYPKRIRKIRLPDTPKIVWTASQVRQLAEQVERIPGRFPQSEILIGASLGALVRAAWDTGMRRSDLFRLQRLHAERDEWLEMVQRKTGRTILCKLSRDTRAAILRTFDDWAVPRQYVWPSTSSAVRRITGMIAEAAQDLGLPCASTPLKALRRSSITAVEAQAPGTGYLQAGHSTSQTTIRYYLSPTAAQMARPLPPTL